MVSCSYKHPWLRTKIGVQTANATAGPGSDLIFTLILGSRNLTIVLNRPPRKPTVFRDNQTRHAKIIRRTPVNREELALKVRYGEGREAADGVTQNYAADVVLQTCLRSDIVDKRFFDPTRF
ncbi:hypothetical protein EVAR_25280_1 [Eumeta japonica]|uniref:Uncharacterized protein n=1 Tax=Eumeta variegata TaxID=151549 RepID=A0A4C1VMU6_EUMVA|nr:hypothetical protein EVAR_25280_1 [Eumeta japonica]